MWSRTTRQLFGRIARDRAWASAVSAVAFFSVLTAVAPAKPSEPARDPIADEIRRILAAPDGGHPVAAGATLREADALRASYGGRSFAPLWTRAQAASLDSELNRLAEDGLPPARYHARALERLRSADPGDAAAAAALDVLRSDALLAAARDLTTGLVVARTVHGGWSALARRFEPAAVLRRIEDGAEPAAVLGAARPEVPAYGLARAALGRYRQWAERTWPVVEQRRLERGDTGAAVLALRRRLAAENGGNAGSSPAFDAALGEAVRAWQAARGLEPDGIVGPKTHAALRVTPAARAAQLRLALERLRWEAAPVGGPRIDVRIPAFELRLVEDGRDVLHMRVIGGREDWPTPVFDATMRAVVLSPYWNVPRRIAALEVIPAVLRSRAYLSENHMRILAADGRTIDEAAIDWASVRPGSFPHRFRQEPGPENPLGGIKFLLPNRYDVYLHDTPARTLFARADRALSHGCIRLEQPLELATLLLRGTEWDRDRILSVIAGGRERQVPLPRPVPVSIRYTTAWAAADGTVHFRDDRYGHDAALARLLDAPGETAAVAASDSAHAGR